MSVEKRGARAIADLGQGIILATVDILVPPERVFEALASAEVARWWGSPELYRVTAWQGDLRVGGRWRSQGVGHDGKPFAVGGEFLEIDRPRLLVHTWKPDWETAPATTVRYQLDTILGGTRVTVRHDGFTGRPESCQSHATGWERVLTWLTDHLATASPDKSLFFLCRLLAPRPTFAFDMNADEKKVMQDHAAYWRRHLAAGTAIVFGPVVDPQGPWGLGIVRVGSADEVAALEQNDPAILSGRGFSYETLPMLNAVH
jgi:uncharacterized protein YndB with AHSA1/START domain